MRPILPAAGRLSTESSCIVVLAATLFVIAGARAQEDGLSTSTDAARLVYEAPSGCPDEQTFRDLVLGRLGRTPFREDVLRVVRVNMKDLGTSFRATASLPAERVLESSDCDDLAAAVAVVVAMALDAPTERHQPDPPGAGHESTAKNWQGELSPGARAALEALDRENPPRRTEPKEAPPESQQTNDGWIVSLGSSFLATLGLVPKAGLGGQIAVGLHRGWVILNLEARAEASVGAKGAERVRAVAWTGVLAPCGTVEPFFGCAVVAIGGLAARADGVVNPRWATSFYTSGGARIGLDFDFGRAHLRASVEGEVPITRPNFRVAGTSVWQVSPVVGRLSLGVAWLLP